MKLKVILFQSKTEFLSKCRKVKAADWNEKSEVPVRNKQNLWSLLDSSTNARGVSRNLVGRGETGVLYGSHQHARSQPTFAISMQICISVAHLSLLLHFIPMHPSIPSPLWLLAFRLHHIHRLDYLIPPRAAQQHYFSIASQVQTIERRRRALCCLNP